MAGGPRTFLLALFAFLIAALPAQAADRGSFPLAGTADTAAWQGSFESGSFPASPTYPGGSLARAKEFCGATAVCDVATLDVELPAGTWEGDPGGMLVAVQWPHIDGGYDLGLHVYDEDGTEVAASDTLIFSRNEAAWIKNPRNGTYTVVVAPQAVWALPRDVADMLGREKLGPLDYDAFVEFERGLTIEREEINLGLPYRRTIVAHGHKTGEPPEELLPDLVATTPANFHMETGQGAHFYFFMDRDLRHDASCYPQETTGLNEDTPNPRLDGPTRCLRWDQGEYNFGAGPLELHNYSNVGDGTNLWQRTYWTNGDVTQAEAGEVRFSSTHGHFHAQGFQAIGLYERNADGSAGELVATPPDKGICMVDIENANFGRTDRPTHPLQMDLPGTCDNATHSDPNDPTYPNELYLQMGITVGYADVYPWFVADQYMDVSNLPDGRYILRSTVNESRKIRESDYENNTAESCVELNGNSASAC